MNESSWLCYDHLDSLCDVIRRDASTFRIVRIYAKTPEYTGHGARGEGLACVDDAVRAAVLFLRDFEIKGTYESKQKATEFLRFIMFMQGNDGLFYNFVLNSNLDINRTSPTSKPESLDWCTCRAVWAMGEGARILKELEPDLAKKCNNSARRTLPHIRCCLQNYPKTRKIGDLTLPTWIVGGSCADSTSVLLLGLCSLRDAFPDPELDATIEKLADGIAAMQYGTVGEYPYGAHASWEGGWHAWGNVQTQAMAVAGRLESARREADTFYHWLLVDGLRSSMSFDDSNHQSEFPQIAYDIRCIAVGLVRLFEATGDTKYLTLAGLSASWLTGNNAAHSEIYELHTGMCYDGIDEGPKRNENSGAESTIEALLTLQELERYDEAMKWIGALSEEPFRASCEGTEFYGKVYCTSNREEESRIAVVLNLTEKSSALVDEATLTGLLRKEHE